MPRHCFVYGCLMQEKRDNVRLFPFPTSMKRRLVWTKFCGRSENWQTYNAYICERHFVDRKPTTINPDPTMEPALNGDNDSRKRKLTSNSANFSKMRAITTSFCYDAEDPTAISRIDLVQILRRKRLGFEGPPVIKNLFNNERNLAPVEALVENGDEFPVENVPSIPRRSFRFSKSTLKPGPRKRRDVLLCSGFSLRNIDHCYKAKTIARSRTTFTYSSADVGSGSPRHGSETSPTKPLALLVSYLARSRRRTLSKTVIVGQDLKKTSLPMDKLRAIAEKNIKRVKAMEKQHHFVISWDKITGDDKRTRFYTGFESFRVLDSFYERCIKEPSKLLLVAYGKSAKQIQHRRLRREDEFLLVLMKLRLNTLEFMLSDLFGISVSYVSMLIKVWIPFLAKQLGQFLIWVPRDRRSTHPLAFRRYPACSAIVDCFEIRMERPSDPRNARQAWSEYKHSETAKVFIAIAPNGTIMYLSPAWGGRASDQHIVQEDEDFMALLKSEPKGSIILSDKGFRHLSAYLTVSTGAHVVMPRSAPSNEQLARHVVAENWSKSNARIHIERVIGELRNFMILNQKLYMSKLYQLDDILQICAGIVNLRKAIVK